MQTIGNSTFSNCTGIAKYLTIPNSVTSIGDFAFYDCKHMNSVVFGKNIKTIGNYAFCDCEYQIQSFQLEMVLFKITNN